VRVTEPFIIGTTLALLTAGTGWALWRLVTRLRRTEAERQRATAELNRRLSELFSLQELSYLLSESLDSGRIAEQVVRYAIRFCDARGALIALAGATAGETWRIAAAEGVVSQLSGHPVPQDDAGLIARSSRREQLQVEHQPGSGVALVGGASVDTAAAIPLRAHGIVVGTLVAVEPTAGTFTPDGMRLLSTVATHAAVAIANARFFELVRRGKEQWETTFDALREGIAVLDESGCLVRANRSLATLLGGPLPRLIGAPLVEALFGATQRLSDLLAAAGRGEHSPALVARSPTLGRTLRVTAAPILSTAQQRHTVVLVEDVTDQQALERQLIQSEKLAAMGQLVSGVAHELNNPLTSISGLTEFLLEQRELGTHDRGHLRVIHEQAERAGRIVRNLLTFARTGPADRVPVNLNDVAQRTLLLVNRDLQVRNIVVERHLDPALPPVIGDRHELQQVLLNLLTNASQAVERNPPERPRTVAITTWADESVHLRVSDSGPGVPDAVAEHVFTPFFTTKEPGHGTGLGLSICYSIVESHGGRMAIERPPSGAAFRLDLPRAPTDALPPSAAEPAAPAAPAVIPSHRAILLVDTDPAVRITVEALFGREGHAVTVARSTAHAFELARERAFDLVIVDARAAAADGARLFVEELIDHLPEVRSRILVASGDVRPATDEALRRLGVAYVRKPFNLRDLRSEAARVWAAGAAS